MGGGFGNLALWVGQPQLQTALGSVLKFLTLHTGGWGAGRGEDEKRKDWYD